MSPRLLHTGVLAWTHFLLAAATLAAAEKAFALYSRPGTPISITDCHERSPMPGVHVVFDVTAEPQRQYIHSAALRTIGEGEAAIAQGAVLGLTQARFRAMVRIVSDERPMTDGKLCVTPNYHVELAFERMSMLLARELESDRCALDFVANHESMHVLFHREAVRQASLALESDLLKSSSNFVAEDTRAVRQIENDLSDVVGKHAQTLYKKFNVWHATIDTPREYQRALTVCNGAIPRLLGMAVVPPKGGSAPDAATNKPGPGGNKAS